MITQTLPFEGYELNHEIEKEAARVAGLEVLDATNTELFLDLDTVPDYEKFVKRCQHLHHLGLITSYTEYESSKRGNKHAICQLSRPLSLLERVALQCVLGSDLTREYITILRWLEHSETATSTLFRKPQ